MARNVALGFIGFLLVSCQGVIGEGGAASLQGDDAPGVPGSPRDSGATTFNGAANADGPPEELVYVAPEDALGIAPDDFVDIPPEAMIKASRDECTSPCPVFFDAISDLSWQDIESSKFTWAFSDGATADGFMAAHVFELPEGEAEATFEATLVVEQDGFWVARDTHTVTVRPLRGRTICVAQSDFSGCPSDAGADHFTNVESAWNAIETDGRILFRRGDSFSPGIRFGSTVAGPVHVGAFGDPSEARPAIVQSGGSWRLDSDWSLTDLDLTAVGSSGSLISFGGVHTLVMRSHIHDVKGAFVSDGAGYDFATHKFMINNVVTESEGTNFIGGDYIVIVGNHIERWGDKHHTIRIAGGKHVLVANNALLSDVSHTSLTVRGAKPRPESDYVLVQGNLLRRVATVKPQNDTSNERLHHVIWERNVHVPREDEGSTQDGLVVNGDDMVIRNNIFHQMRRAITIETHPLAGASHDIHVYQNTQFVDQDEDATHYFCKAGSGTAGTVVTNNLALLYSRSSSSNFASVGVDAVVANNYSYAPARTALCERPDGSSTCTDPKLINTTDHNSPDFMRPQADSLAIDAAVDSSVPNDFYGTLRPQGEAPDVGAVERTE